MLFKELLRLLPSHKSTKKDILSFARAATRMAKSTTPTVSEVTEFAKTKALASQDHAMLRPKPENSRCLSSFPKNKHGDIGIHSKVLWWMAITLKILCLKKLMIGNYRSRNHIPKSKCDTLLGKGEKVGMSKNRYCLSSSKEFPKGCVLFPIFRCHCILNLLFWKTIHYTTTPDS